MSANLMWEPAKRKAKSLPSSLMYILRDNFGLNDGRQTWTRANVPYLTALVHARIDGAQELIDAIEQHEEVEIWLEY